MGTKLPSNRIVRSIEWYPLVPHPTKFYRMGSLPSGSREVGWDADAKLFREPRRFVSCRSCFIAYYTIGQSNLSARHYPQPYCCRREDRVFGHLHEAKRHTSAAPCTIFGRSVRRPNSGPSGIRQPSTAARRLWHSKEVPRMYSARMLRSLEVQ